MGVQSPTEINAPRGRKTIVWETMVLRRPERSVECSDSKKKMSACADQNHAPSLTCVRLERKFCVCLVFYYKFHGATREIPLFCREIRVNFIKISWIFRCNACFLTLERCFYWTEYVNFAMIIVVWIFIYLSLSWDSHFCKWWVVTSISQWEFNLRLR